MDAKGVFANFTGGILRGVLMKAAVEPESITEIRIRINKPLGIKISGREYFIKGNGSISAGIDSVDAWADAYKPTPEDIQKTMELMSNYSLYAFEEEIKNGYITVQGGHRVGICGQAVVDNNNIKTIKNINGFNIRITHEVKGCADKIINYAAKPRVKHTMIISPPGCGKTTLVRDVARILSNGDKSKGIRGHNVGIADERSEIAGCYMGIPQNDVGIRTDVLDACPKAKGMMMLLRSMSPEVIIADEIGRAEDIAAIDEIINSGVMFICTVHGGSIDELMNKENLSPLISKKIFDIFIVLKHQKGPGEIAGVYDSGFKNIYTG